MQCVQVRSRETSYKGWKEISFDPHLILIFSGLKKAPAQLLKGWRRQFPEAVMSGCSTAGEIAGTELREDPPYLLDELKQVLISCVAYEK